jgi:hypothetical protein
MAAMAAAREAAAERERAEDTSLDAPLDTSLDTSPDTSLDAPLDMSLDVSLDTSSLGYPFPTPDGRPCPEELATFRFAGIRARPRKQLPAQWRVGETYLKPPGSCGTRCDPL